jgi:hypothetical protein
MTIRSIARQLGISSAAVSLGLHNSPRVSEKMRARIMALAKSSGYIPNVRLSELMSEVRKGQTLGYRATLGAFSFYPQETPWDERPYLKEMLDAAIGAAAAHGYRMEYFWLRKPGLSVNRFCSILRARGIQGLFCLGSPDADEAIPEPLWQFAMVVQGPSIADKLHRVVTHAGVTPVVSWRSCWPAAIDGRASGSSPRATNAGIMCIRPLFLDFRSGEDLRRRMYRFYALRRGMKPSFKRGGSGIDRMCSCCINCRGISRRSMRR